MEKSNKPYIILSAAISIDGKIATETGDSKLSSDQELGLVFPDYYVVDEKGSIIHEEKRHDFKKVTLFKITK